ncbi:hypothetical protein NTGHW29_450028 [Candidatus Nitrotoga sp. HW29]|nr:hypothetical protein NTGHW29_450028 [Candidatus Nitrotoga sp. HW29]
MKQERNAQPTLLIVNKVIDQNPKETLINSKFRGIALVTN